MGAGGGSIAYLDDGGFLGVGPRSAGAHPGPACYGRGGLEPTVTDANVVLGRFRPSDPLGRSLEIDVSAAEAAIGLAILVVLFRNRQTINVDDLDSMKG